MEKAAPAINTRLDSQELEVMELKSEKEFLKTAGSI